MEIIFDEKLLIQQNRFIRQIRIINFHLDLNFVRRWRLVYYTIESNLV